MQSHKKFVQVYCLGSETFLIFSGGIINSEQAKILTVIFSALLLTPDRLSNSRLREKTTSTRSLNNTQLKQLKSFAFIYLLNLTVRRPILGRKDLMTLTQSKLTSFLPQSRKTFSGLSDIKLV